MSFDTSLGTKRSRTPTQKAEIDPWDESAWKALSLGPEADDFFSKHLKPLLNEQRHEAVARLILNQFIENPTGQSYAAGLLKSMMKSPARRRVVPKDLCDAHFINTNDWDANVQPVGWLEIKKQLSTKAPASDSSPKPLLYAGQFMRGGGKTTTAKCFVAVHFKERSERGEVIAIDCSKTQLKRKEGSSVLAGSIAGLSESAKSHADESALSIKFLKHLVEHHLLWIKGHLRASKDVPDIVNSQLDFAEVLEAWRKYLLDAGCETADADSAGKIPFRPVIVLDTCEALQTVEMKHKKHTQQQLRGLPYTFLELFVSALPSAFTVVAVGTSCTINTSEIFLTYANVETFVPCHLFTWQEFQKVQPLWNPELPPIDDKHARMCVALCGGVARILRELTVCYPLAVANLPQAEDIVWRETLKRIQSYYRSSGSNDSEYNVCVVVAAAASAVRFGVEVNATVPFLPQLTWEQLFASSVCALKGVVVKGKYMNRVEAPIINALVVAKDLPEVNVPVNLLCPNSGYFEVQAPVKRGKPFEVLTAACIVARYEMTRQELKRRRAASPGAVQSPDDGWVPLRELLTCNPDLPLSDPNCPAHATSIMVAGEYEETMPEDIEVNLSGGLQGKVEKSYEYADVAKHNNQNGYKNKYLLNDHEGSCHHDAYISCARLRGEPDAVFPIAVQCRIGQPKSPGEIKSRCYQCPEMKQHAALVIFAHCPTSDDQRVKERSTTNTLLTSASANDASFRACYLNVGCISKFVALLGADT